ncbi:MAG: DNA replication and repair protein RecF [Bacteroidales bacterium]|nr:DNA replication and repair protein RecF [Bacteroidales bacterium]
MYLHKINLQNFKNIAEGHLEFSPRINCISGGNGEGKTNLLDAVYYLSMTKSYFHASEQFCCRVGEKQMVLSGEYEMSDGTRNLVAASLEGSVKQVRFNKKNYERLSDHIGIIPIVMISPADNSLINDAAEQRRRFVNIILSQTDREYLRSLQSYNKLLQYRNKLLKQDVPQQDLIETITFKMNGFAGYIHSRRKSLAADLNVKAQEYYRLISDGKEEISLVYVSDMENCDLNTLFQKNMSRDLALRYTSSGPQRDDLTFNMNGYPIRSCGSQGQQKTFLMALKLAEFELMANHYGFAPILLLDDIFDKLDSRRVEFLLKLVANDNFGQIFITDSNKVRLDKIVNSIDVPSAMFSVSAGNFSKEEIG